MLLDHAGKQLDILECGQPESADSLHIYQTGIGAGYKRLMEARQQAVWESVIASSLHPLQRCAGDQLHYLQATCGTA